MIALLLCLTASAAEPEATVVEPSALHEVLTWQARHPADDPYATGDPTYVTDKPGWLVASTLGVGAVALVTGGKALSYGPAIRDAETASEVTDLEHARSRWGAVSLTALGLTAVGATVYAAW